MATSRCLLLAAGLLACGDSTSTSESATAAARDEILAFLTGRLLAKNCATVGADPGPTARLS